MKTNITTIMLGSAAMIAIATPAAAQTTTGTAAGTKVENTATINYSSGGVAQNAVNSNTSDFVVDEKINLTVAELGGQSTPTGGGGTGYVTTFTVTNLSNAAQDFALTATQDQGGTTAFGQTDAFDLANLKVYVDNGDGIFNPAQDTLTFIDELAPGATATVFVVGDVPTNTADGLYAGVTLTAQAADNGTAGTLGALQVQNTGADREDAVDIVFADAKGDTDAQYDGKHSDDDQYLVQAPALVLSKTSAVISDPVSGAIDPNRIPGAVVEYCIVATNGGTGSASGAVITDNLATVLGVTYVPGSIKVGATVSGGVCSGGTAVSDTADSDGGSFVGTTVSGSLGTIAAGASTGIRFQVTIN